jgi:hypothetical protein
MIYKVIFIIGFTLLLGSCQNIPSTQNPTSPEKDSPLILGDPVSPPTGCVKWRKKYTDQEWKPSEDCCPNNVEVEVAHYHAADC